MPPSLTYKQQAFANGIISGLGPSDAYKSAGYNCSRMSTKVISIEAQKLLKHPRISLVIREAEEMVAKAESAVWSREEAIRRAKRINDVAFKRLNIRIGEKDKDAVKAFFDSYDRLNKLMIIDRDIATADIPQIIFETEDPEDDSAVEVEPESPGDVSDG